MNEFKGLVAGFWIFTALFCLEMSFTAYYELLRLPEAAQCGAEFEKPVTGASIVRKGQKEKFSIRVISVCPAFPRDGLLSANLNHNRTHAFAAGILPMCLLDLIKPEGVFDWYGDPSVFEPFKKLLQI
jgi:hypothetical protein